MLVLQKYISPEKMSKIFHFEKANDLVKDTEFMLALRFGDPLSEKVINNLKKFITPTITDFDEYVDEIWDFKYQLEIGKSVRMIVQHLRNPDVYMTFTSIDNGKYVPQFNESLRKNLEYINNTLKSSILLI